MERNRLRKYLMITFLITWSCWWADAFLVKITALTESDVLPMLLFTVGGFGPTIAGCMCMKPTFDKKTLKSFLIPHHRIHWLVLFTAIFLETIVFGMCSNGINPMLPQSPLAGIVILIVFLQAATLYGGNEEWGWRGTMQPILEQALPSPIATLIVGIVWISWHIPLWFIPGNSHQSMSFLYFSITGLALSYWLSALYNLTGAVLLCMILHGWTNTLLGVVNITPGFLYYGSLAVLIVIAIAASLSAQRQNVSPHIAK